MIQYELIDLPKIAVIGKVGVFVNLKVEQKGFQKVSTCQHRQFRGSPCRAAG